MSFDVITIGSALVDTFVSTDSDLVRIDTRHHKEEFIAFPLGSKVLINKMNQTTGGGGTNTAVSFARLGLNTGFLGKIGDDSNGEFIVDMLKEEKVQFLGPRAKGLTSGFSFVMDSMSGDRTILTYKGVNDTLHIDEVGELDTKWIYSSSMMHESFETIVKIAQMTEAKFAFNPSSYQAVQGYEKLKPLIDNLEVLIMNKEEACEFLGLNSGAVKSVPELMDMMRHLPPKYLVITNGKDGSYVWDREKLYHARPSNNVQVVETTGAGDSLASGFVAGLAQGKDTLYSLRLGMINCESVISKTGAKEALMFRDEANQAVMNDVREINISEI
ncbi:carbohydrate kinase family protein [Marinicellulosiphila megalodicopiae]|uniref:carbohydrate kinase family protein n=1 Tax=Marinicellulosiphila megalodicopiae TaxID=2724896 RepID=UPI003BB0E4E2